MEASSISKRSSLSSERKENVRMTPTEQRGQGKIPGKRMFAYGIFSARTFLLASAFVRRVSLEEHQNEAMKEEVTRELQDVLGSFLFLFLALHVVASAPGQEQVRRTSTNTKKKERERALEQRRDVLLIDELAKKVENVNVGHLLFEVLGIQLLGLSSKAIKMSLEQQWNKRE